MGNNLMLDAIEFESPDYVCLTKTLSAEKAIEIANKYKTYNFNTFMLGELNKDMTVSVSDIKIRPIKENQFGLDVTVYYVMARFNIEIG